jgi:hypothetical protein
MREVPFCKFLGPNKVGMVGSEELFRSPALLKDGKRGTGEIRVSSERSVLCGSLPNVIDILGGPRLWVSGIIQGRTIRRRAALGLYNLS